MKILRIVVGICLILAVAWAVLLCARRGTESMAAQVVTPILAGTLLKHISYSMLFPYAAFFVACSFVTMCFVRHGDTKAQAKKGLEAFEDMD